MDQVWIVISMILGFVLRIGVPILLTILIANGLRKLDKKWQEDGRKILIHDIPFAERIIEDMNCWEFFECSETKRKQCNMQSQAGEPCWQLCLAAGGDPAECLDCKYKELMEKEIPSTAKLIIRDK